MRGQSAKRRKTTAMASPGVPTIDRLPQDLLETISGFLDVRTLCTARLVCAQFRGAASRCIHSVEISADTLRSQPEAALNNFPNLSRVSVFDVRTDDLEMVAQSPVAAAVTHLWAYSYFRQEPARIGACFPLVPFPKLTSLTLGGYGSHCASLFPQTLRELILEASVNSQTAELVAGMTSLTSLGIDIHEMREPFKAVTALTALQRLEIEGRLSDIIPFVAELTLLTHLHFEEFRRLGTESPALAPLASLSRLRRLEHLGVSHYGRSGADIERQILAGVAPLTSLRSLDLTLCERTERSAYDSMCMAPVSLLTALRLQGGGLEASFLPRFNLERLRELNLSDWVGHERDAVAALGRATGLTRLGLWTQRFGTTVRPEEWEFALSRISGLRAFSLASPAGCQPTFSLTAIAPLTELTRLELSGEGVTTNAAVQACLRLKKLRVLSIEAHDGPPTPPDPITPETFFAIARLPELRKFGIAGKVGISAQDLTDDVRAWLNVERRDKGWPPLEF